MPVIAQPTGMLSSLLGRKSSSGAQLELGGVADLPDQIVTTLETRALWSRYGL